MDTYSNTFLRFQLSMEPFGDEQTAGQYMLDAINEDMRANTAQQIGEEDARIADSFLNMSRDGDEEDDDFAPPPNQQHVPVRILIMHGDLGRLVLRLTYLFCNLVDLCIDFVEPIKRETPADQENGGKTGRNRSGHRGLSKCSRGCWHEICQPMWGYCLGKNSDHHKTMEIEQTRRTGTRSASTSEGNAMDRTQGYVHSY